MSFDARYLGSEIQEPINFMNNVTIDEIKRLMEEICEVKGVPAVFEKNSVVAGSFFNKKTYECLLIRHPNPPQEYCAQIYTLAGNVVTFNYVGNSKAFRENNEYEDVRNGNGTTITNLKYMFTQPDKIALQQELSWHGTIINVFNSLLVKEM